MFGKFDANAGGSGGSSLTVVGPVALGGLTVDFVGVPAGAKRITWCFNNVVKNAVGVANICIVRIGAGSFLAAGYNQAGGWQGVQGNCAISSNATGFIWHDGYNNNDATQINQAMLIFVLMDALTHTWAMTLNGSIQNVAGGAVPRTDINYQSAGSVALGASLDRLQLTTVAGTASFTAGTYSLIVE